MTETAAAAARRQKKKNQKQVNKERNEQESAQRIRTAQDKAQKKRSEVFVAARKGDKKAVRKAIWEEGVSASDTEFLFTVPKIQHPDPKETLLHIAVDHGQSDLAEWLLNHGAFLVLLLIMYLKT